MSQSQSHCCSIPPHPNQGHNILFNLHNIRLQSLPGHISYWVGFIPLLINLVCEAGYNTSLSLYPCFQYYHPLQIQWQIPILFIIIVSIILFKFNSRLVFSVSTKALPVSIYSVIFPLVDDILWELSSVNHINQPIWYKYLLYIHLISANK